MSSANLIEAALAFQESVNLAREAHDYNCLIIALIWFQQHPELRFQISDFNKSEQSIMDFIKSQSKHVESAYLLSLVHLVGAKVFLLEVRQRKFNHATKAIEFFSFDHPPRSYLKFTLEHTKLVG